MTVTSLKLPADLKKRIADLVAGTPQTAHAFMVEAIAREAERATLRRRFVAEALDARRDFVRSRRGHRLGDVREYVLARAAGNRVRRPRARKWPKS